MALTRFQIACGAMVGALALTACGGGSAESSSDAGGDSSAAPSGTITVLTQRTDLVNSTFKDYKKTFEAKFPEVKVNFEAITDYEGEVRIRMNTKDYGDVLPIPNSVTADQLPTFFEPLGTVDELKQKYRFIDEQAYDGKGYGLAVVGNAQGFVYNKKVWAKAGVNELPTTPDAFLADLQKVKATGAIPLYTNYKDGWPLTQWEGDRGAISANADAVNELATDDAPWAEGKDHYVSDKLLFDAVKNKLTEPDPTTTDWESSKNLLGTGKVATMRLGSWAVTQMQASAPNKADVGYMPFPVQVDGKFHTVIAGDYKNGINRNSEHKAAARAWVDWFANESGYAETEGGISPVKSDKLPESLKDFQDAKVEFIELTPAPAGKESLVGNIDKQGEIGLYEPTYRQRIVDAARGAKDESLEDIFGDLNKRWSEARKTAES